MTVPVLEYQPKSLKPFLDYVVEQSDQKLTMCYQCRRCAAGCPVSDETSITPDRLIRMVLLGDKDGALDNQLVWRCVSCYTCGTRCPNNIQTSRITSVLKNIAKEKKIKPFNINIFNFHVSFLKSSMRWGRLNETEFLGIYEFKGTLNKIINNNYKAIYNELKKQILLGFTMLRKKRLHFKLQMVKNRKEMKLLKKIAKNKKAMGSETNK